MSKAATIEVSSSLLRWARESAGLSIDKAAKRTGIKPDRLAAWETRNARPTPRQIERLAEAYKRPVAVFFLPQPPTEAPLPLDFRVLPSGRRSTLSEATLLALRRARRLKQVYAELKHHLGERAVPALAHVRLSHHPEQASRAVREMLAVSMEVLAGRTPHEVLNVWRGAVERLDVLVFQFGMPLAEIRGFSLAEGVPAIVLNTKDSPHARIFTVVHELAHLLLRRPGLCNPDETVEPRADGDVEAFCNAVAGACLVPLDALLARGPVAALRRGRARLDDALADGVAAFGVSRRVILRRLLKARVVSEREYRRITRGWDEDARARPKKRSTGGPAPALRTVSELGRPFVSQVLHARERHEITDADVADYLSIRLKHLPRVQALVTSE